MEIQVMVLWVMTPCGNAVSYQHFGGLRCFHPQGEGWVPYLNPFINIQTQI